MDFGTTHFYQIGAIIQQTDYFFSQILLVDAVGPSMAIPYHRNNASFGHDSQVVQTGKKTYGSDNGIIQSGSPQIILEHFMNLGYFIFRGSIGALDGYIYKTLYLIPKSIFQDILVSFKINIFKRASFCGKKADTFAQSRNNMGNTPGNSSNGFLPFTGICPPHVGSIRGYLRGSVL